MLPSLYRRVTFETFFLVDVVPGRTSISITWDALLAENTKLEFKVENEMFVRIAECRGHLGRKVNKNLSPQTTYNVTIHKETLGGMSLRREVIFSGLVRMPDISEFSTLYETSRPWFVIGTLQ